MTTTFGNLNLYLDLMFDFLSFYFFYFLYVTDRAYALRKSHQC